MMDAIVERILICANHRLIHIFRDWLNVLASVASGYRGSCWGCQRMGYLYRYSVSCNWSLLAHSTLCAHCALCTLLHAMHGALSQLHTIHSILYRRRCTLHIVRLQAANHVFSTFCTLYVLRTRALCALHFALRTRCTLHTAPDQLCTWPYLTPPCPVVIIAAEVGFHSVKR